MKVKRPDLSLLKKMFLVDLIKGLLLTFSYQRPSANYTEQYPKERPKIAERFRGRPRLNNDPVRVKRCASRATSARWPARSTASKWVGNAMQQARRR